MAKSKNLTHRKTACTLHVMDVEGKPVSSKKLKLTQTNHEFLFGCGAFDAIPFTTPDMTAHGQVKDPKPFSFYEERMKKWLALYNYGTLPFYWGNYETAEGKPEYETRMKAAQFLTSHGITVKGHPLCWHTACADWLLKYDNKTILEKQLARIMRDVTAFKGVINMWDVINEVVIMPIFDRYDNAITRICKDLGRIGIVKEVFAAAKEANPDGVFLINDFNTSISYEILIDGCLQTGIPITAIGIQSHQHQGYWGLEKLGQVLSRYEHFGLPIHFTENTFVSGPLIPPEIEDLNDWHYDDMPPQAEYEERQKNDTESMYRILFDHPLVEAVTGWDFTDGAWLNAPSGVIRKDNSEKPVYHMLENLIHKEWWTETEVITNANGFVSVEGFKGSYILRDSSVKNTQAKLTLKDDLPSQDITLL